MPSLRAPSGRLHTTKARITNNQPMKVTIATERLSELNRKLIEGSITEEEMEEMEDLLSLCGQTVHGEQPEPFKSETKH